MYSIVALRTFVLAFVSNELLPKRRVLIKTGSQRCIRLLSMFLWYLGEYVFLMARSKRYKAHPFECVVNYLYMSFYQNDVC